MLPVYTYREFSKILLHNGFKIIRQRGSHVIWGRGTERCVTTIVEINPKITDKIIKKHNLVVKKGM